MLTHRLYRRAAAFVAVSMAILLSLPTSAIARLPNDPLFSEQWYLTQIDAPEAWSTTLGFEGVVVAVIDSGVDLLHPDIQPNIWTNVREIAGDGFDNDLNGFVDDVHGWDFIDNDNDANPVVTSGTNIAVSHGTISAGVIAARGDNNEGIVGVTWQTQIMPLRALDGAGNGDTFGVVRAIDYAITNGAKVINLSFAGEVDDSLLGVAVQRAYDNGVVVVAAAGNAPTGGSAVNLNTTLLNPVCLDYDKSLPYVIGVAATDEADKKATFSNFGGRCVDVSAPGTRFLAAQFFRVNTPPFDSPYGGFYNGTSLAAPVVSGVVALMLSVNPALGPSDILAILRKTSVSLDSQNPEFVGMLGAGRVSAAKAVQEALKTTPQPRGSLPLAAGESVHAIAAGSGYNEIPTIGIFSLDGILLRRFAPFPATQKGGLSLAAGALGNDAELAVSVQQSAAPEVRIFGRDGTQRTAFFAYDPLFRGGVRVAAGDVDGDGRDEIITGAGAGGGPHVRIFRPDGSVVGGFFAYDPLFRGGVRVAAGDVDGDGRDEIIVTPLSGTRPGRVFKKDGSLLSTFSLEVAGAGFLRDVRMIDANLDGIIDIVLRFASATVLRVYGGDGTYIGDLLTDTGLFASKTATSPLPRRGGMFVLGSVIGERSLVRTLLGGIPTQFLTASPLARGGVDAEPLP